MESKLLEYYNRELAYLREMGAEFAERYPKVAGRLGFAEYARSTYNGKPIVLLERPRR